MDKYLAVAIGGAMGALLRFALQNWSFGRFGMQFPYGTLAVNLSGAFLIGLLMTIFLHHLHIGPLWRLLTVTGFLGGYTTFSALTWEVYSLAEKGHVSAALVYSGASLAGGMLALLLGIWLGRSFFA